jgi:hypothetical protein
MSKTKVVDYALGTGVYTGDLKYGRANGRVVEKGRDFPANYTNNKATNEPLVPLVLVRPRDPEVWTSERQLVKKAKQKVSNFQHAVNYWIESFQQNKQTLKSNIHLTVGKQRI